MEAENEIKEHGNIASSFAYFRKHRIRKDAKILDVGCSFGSLVLKMENAGYKDVKGIDTNRSYIIEGRKAHPGIKNLISSYDGKSIPFKDSGFDVITMFDVMEHIPKLGLFLRKEVRRVLKKGGILVFQTPNKMTNIPWEIIHQRSLTRWKRYHPSLQTPKSLKRILMSAGFRDITIEKHLIDTAHNRQKIRRRIGAFAPAVIKAFERMPLALYPNLWGWCRK